MKDKYWRIDTYERVEEIHRELEDLVKRFFEVNKQELQGQKIFGAKKEIAESIKILVKEKEELERCR